MGNSIFKRDSLLHLPLNKIKRQKVEETLIFTSEDFNSGERVVNSLSYGTYDGCLLVPRHYLDLAYPDKKVEYDDSSIIDTIEKNKVQVRFEKDLKDYQEAPLLALILGGRDNVLVMGCGRGKTVMSICYATLMSTRTLVLVDNEVLLNQWIKEIVFFTDLSRPEVGVVQGNVCKIGKITVATVQTLLSRYCNELDYERNEFLSQFGLVILDEGDVYGATRSSEVMRKTCGMRLLITATFNRTDGREYVYRYHVGEPTYTDLETELVPQVMVVLTGKSYVRGKSGNPVSRLYKYGIMSRVNVITRLSKERERNKTISNVVQRAYSSNRVVVVLSERIEQLVGLMEDFVATNGDEDVAMVLGKQHDHPMNFAKRDNGSELAKEKQVIFAISKLLFKGFDKNTLDVLVECLPYDNANQVQQRIGRTLRSYPGKKQPVVVYFLDEDKPLIKIYERFKERVLALWPNTKFKTTKG